MKAIEKLFWIQNKRNTLLCVGLDPDVNKFPQHYSRDVQGVFNFCNDIIECTKNLTAAYKINFAFFEVFGKEGFGVIENLKQSIPNNIFTIADAKRSDIGNSAQFYAKTIFEHFDFDAITINPLMGRDSIDPFLDYTNKFTYSLGLTSNLGADDFLKQIMWIQKPIFLYIIEKLAEWYSIDNIGFVVGATQSDYFETIRKAIPNHNLLIPGVGAQGGDLNKLKEIGLTPSLINVSRDILYPAPAQDYKLEVIKKTSYYKHLLAIEETTIK